MANNMAEMGQLLGKHSATWHAAVFGIQKLTVYVYNLRLSLYADAVRRAAPLSRHIDLFWDNAAWFNLKKMQKFTSCKCIRLVLFNTSKTTYLSEARRSC